MSVHKKLMQARIALQNTQLKKSGHNKFAGYQYFELGDFLPTIQNIFNEIGLCGYISYSADVATLTIVDIEDNSFIVITSPMAEANLKGTHPIQNLGAVETYQRRYLWMTAMEIVEHDVLDATTGANKLMDAGELQKHLMAIEKAATADELKKLYFDAFNAAKEDPAAQKQIIEAKNKRKGEL